MIRRYSWVSLLGFVLLTVLLPLWFGEILAASLAKLHLRPAVTLGLVAAILLGGFINIPIARINRSQPVSVHPFATFGLDPFFPGWTRVPQETIIAVNVGGCLIPAGLAMYELIHLAALGSGLLVAVAVAAIVNVAVCYAFAQPVAGVGITMPGLVPALVAAITAWLLAPEQAAPVAFVAGVTGPLVGADLLHLKDIGKVATGIASIGGAGTFDGIVLSGIVAAYLA